MKKITAIAVAFVCSLAGLSQPAEAAAWTNLGSITNVNEQPATGAGANQVFVQVEVTTNPSGCTPVNSFYFAIVDDRTKRIFVTLLAAQLANRSVQLYLTGVCHSVWGAAELDGVLVQ